MEYKHYIRLNLKNEIIYAFCDAYDTPNRNDILVEESDTRQFTLDLVDNNGDWKYKWENYKIVEISEEEKRKDKNISIIKSELLDFLKINTHDELSKTDYYIIRKMERNIEIPNNITEERKNIIKYNNEYENKIKESQDINKIYQYKEEIEDHFK
jgi:hypothetical protein